MPYNGWSNYETWVVNMWADNSLGRSPTMEDIEYMEETMQDDFYEMVGGACNVYTDLINFQAIDWQEIKDHIEE